MSLAFKAAILVAAGMLVSAVGTGCTRGNPAGTQSQTGSGVETAPGAADTTPAPLAALVFRLSLVANGLDRPLFLTHARDGSGRLFVVEQGGRIRVVRDGKLVSRPFLDISKSISSGGERGLLGLAFSPDYRNDGRFYVDFTDRDGNTMVVRYVAADPASDHPRLSAPETILKVQQPYANHNGGCTIFGPDGRLWVGMGDGGNAGDPGNRAQNDRVLLGKLLAIDVNAGVQPPAIVAKGLRNPWRFSFDRTTGDLWIGDVGQASYEEIDFVASADVKPLLNFGWNLWEGDHPYPPGAKRSRDSFIFPVIEHSHKEAQAITGGYVYRGTSQPALVGTYVYGDFEAGWLAAARRTGGSTDHRIVLENARIAPSSFGEDERGEIYVCDYNGSVFRLGATSK